MFVPPLFFATFNFAILGRNRKIYAANFYDAFLFVPALIILKVRGYFI
jgi:hypothetical protein